MGIFLLFSSKQKPTHSTKILDVAIHVPERPADPVWKEMSILTGYHNRFLLSSERGKNFFREEKTMSSKYPNNNREKSPLSLRRRLLIGGLVGGALVGAGKISDFWWSSLWSSFFKPAPSPTLYTYAGHPSGVSSVAWSPDGTSIASVGWDQTIQVWNARNGQRLLTYRGHPDARSVVWSPDSTRIASAGNNFTVQIWHARTGQQIWTHQNSRRVRLPHSSGGLPTGDRSPLLEAPTITQFRCEMRLMGTSS